MSEATIIDLDDLQEIMSSLPEPPGEEKRRNTLTRDDVIVIARIVRAVSHKVCPRFTPEEITLVKRVVSTLNKGILAVGYAVLAAIGAGIVSIAWWAVKHGIAEVAAKGGK